MVFVTNVFFPVQNPPEYKQLFRRGGCPRWLLDPRLGPPRLSADWLPSAGWRYDVPNSTIIYSSTNEAREPPHTFPFNLFLPRRMSSRFALIKRDFFCQNSQIQSTILLEGANEAGLLFRGIGERNFWAVLLQKGGGIYLIRVKNGEKQILGTVGNFRVQGSSSFRCMHACIHACSWICETSIKSIARLNSRQVVHRQRSGTNRRRQCNCRCVGFE